MRCPRQSQLQLRDQRRVRHGQGHQPWLHRIGREEQGCDRLRDLHGAGHHHGAPRQVGNGYTPVLDCKTSHITCKFDKLLQKLDHQTGKELEAEPEFIENGDSTLVILILTKPLCVEIFMEYPLLAGSLSVT